MDAPVVEYWPEFAAGGKETIPVSLPAVAPSRPGVDRRRDDRRGSVRVGPGRRRARRARSRTGNRERKHGYHATTYGWLVGEVIRRVTGKSVGTYFRDEIATPLGLDFWIGLPESEEARVATLEGWVGDLIENAETRSQAT